MTLAFETPFYVEGLGGFIIEDQLLVTDDGYECMAEAPRGLSDGWSVGWRRSLAARSLRDGPA